MFVAFMIYMDTKKAKCYGDWVELAALKLKLQAVGYQACEQDQYPKRKDLPISSLRVQERKSKQQVTGNSYNAHYFVCKRKRQKQQRRKKHYSQRRV